MEPLINSSEKATANNPSSTSIYKNKIVAGLIVAIPSIIAFFVFTFFQKRACPVYLFELLMFFISLVSLGYICQKTYLYYDDHDRGNESPTQKPPKRKALSYTTYVGSVALALLMISQMGPRDNSKTIVEEDIITSTTSKTSVSSTTFSSTTLTTEATVYTTTVPHTIHEGVVYDSSGSHICSDCSAPAYYGILGLDGTPALWYCRKDYEDILEIEAELKAAKTSTKPVYTTTRTTYTNRKCVVCGKYGTHSIVGISGQTEYYCDQHYRELSDMYVSMFYPELY